MTKSQRLWLRAARLLSDRGLFDAERERVLDEHPLLNSHGLGQTWRRRRSVSPDGRPSGRWEPERLPDDLVAAREELRAGGQSEAGIRNTLEFFVEGRVSLSYRLQGCVWARRFNGPAPPRRSSYGLKHEVERYLGRDGQASGEERRRDASWPTHRQRGVHLRSPDGGFANVDV